MSNLWPSGHMWLRMAMNATQYKIVNLLKTLWGVFLWSHVTIVLNVWPKTTLLPVWPRDIKRLDTPAGIVQYHKRDAHWYNPSILLRFPQFYLYSFVFVVFITFESSTTKNTAVLPWGSHLSFPNQTHLTFSCATKKLILFRFPTVQHQNI